MTPNYIRTYYRGVLELGCIDVFETNKWLSFEFPAPVRTDAEIKGRYILRHFIRSEEKVRLSGYRVELQIKSTEYKAQDDTKTKKLAETK